jgi:hypothetical protein
VSRFDWSAGSLSLYKDRDRLERFWSRWTNTLNLAASDDFGIAAGDLQLDSRHVVDGFIQVVGRPGMFGPRFDAMVALGKIGSTAGEEAGATIAQHIYESSQQVATVQNLSIQRIRTHASDWDPCTVCVRGMVPENHGMVPSFLACPACKGLGWVQTV